jgi:hypothetical protein
MTLCFVIPTLAVSSTHYEASCVENQRARLMELFYGNVILPFHEGEDVNVPAVNFIMPPEGDRDYFIIGVTEVPSQECIEFILSYTGIPQELAYIAQAIFNTRILPYQEVEYSYDECMYLHLEKDEYFQEIARFQSWWGMGQRIFIEGLGGMTMGHPLNSNLQSFATSPHTPNARGRNVFIHGTNHLIGSVRSAFVNSQGDVALVDLHGQNFINSTVQGGTINIFRATANRNDSVVSMRGWSGMQSSWVDSTIASAWHPFGVTMHNLISTYPVRAIQYGDSGAALIRRMSPTDRAVLGTLIGDIVIGSRWVALYTPVTRY